MKKNRFKKLLSLLLIIVMSLIQELSVMAISNQDNYPIEMPESVTTDMNEYPDVIIDETDNYTSEPSKVNERALLPIAPFNAEFSQISYDEIEIINNVDANDYIIFKKLKYVQEEDKNSRLTINVYRDAQRTSSVYTTTTSSNNVQGTNDNTYSIGDTLGKDAGILYFTFKFQSKEESDLIPISYSAEKVSPAVAAEDVVIENRYNGSSLRVYLTVNNMTTGDAIYIYKKLANGTISLLGSALCGNRVTYAATNFVQGSDYDSIVLTQKKLNQHVSEDKTEFVIPGPSISTPLLAANVELETKYDGSYETVYLTVNNMAVGDYVYAYKLLSNGTYSSLGSIYCGSQTGSGTTNFRKTADFDKVYLTVRQADKYESTTKLELAVPATKVSPLLSDKDVTIESKFDGTYEKVSLTVNNLSMGDYVYVYKKLANGTLSSLGSMYCNSSSGVATNNFTKTADFDRVYLTQRKKDQMVSAGNIEIVIPAVKVTTFGTDTSDYPNPVIVAKDRTGNDIVEFSGLSANTQVFIYNNSTKTTRLSYGTLNAAGSITISNISNYPVIYVTLRAPDKLESEVIAVTPQPPVTTAVNYDGIEITNNSGTSDVILFKKLKYTLYEEISSNVIVTIYSNSEKTTKLYSAAISYKYMQGNQDYSLYIGNILGKDSGTAYVTFKYPTKAETGVIAVNYGAEKTS